MKHQEITKYANTKIFSRISLKKQFAHQCVKTSKFRAIFTPNSSESCKIFELFSFKTFCLKPYLGPNKVEGSQGIVIFPPMFIASLLKKVAPFNEDIFSTFMGIFPLFNKM